MKSNLQATMIVQKSRLLCTQSSLILAVIMVFSPVTWGVLDEDVDGMSDVWEQLFGAEGLAPNGDQDGDGQSNLEESLAGTNPFDVTSVLGIINSGHHVDAVVASWGSALGTTYQVEKSAGLNSNWTEVGSVLRGTGNQMWAFVPSDGEARLFVRVGVFSRDVFGNLPSSVDALVDQYDMDEDGVSDMQEFRLGFDPLNAGSKLPNVTLAKGNVAEFEWDAVKGKIYFIQQLMDDGITYETVGGPFDGVTGRMKSFIQMEGELSTGIRVAVQEVDTDSDGLTDWEEMQIGFNSEVDVTDHLGLGDYGDAVDKLAAVNRVTVKASHPIANITSMENGGFLIERTGGAKELSVVYTIAGTAVAGVDYESLSGTVTIPFGVDSVVVPVIPLAGSSLGHSGTVDITIQDAAAYDLGAQFTQRVNVVKEIVINVKDHGAIGDGVTDDTAAIQSAIDALEDSMVANTLYFPAGKYRLATITADFDSPFGWKRMLKIGYRVDLSNRDIFFKGAVGSSLYSDVSPIRVNMLIVRASYRSFHVRGLRFEKDSVPLAAVHYEPNFSDALTISADDLRITEGIFLSDCKFVNCHRAVSVYGAGYDIRGYGGYFSMKGCEVLNPYGSNTANGAGWGGGQQIYLAAWVDTAHYEGCLFDGGSDDLTDAATSPGGKLKDGCHFGSPKKLIFRNNTVLRMGVEAVHQTNETTFMGATTEDFLMPPPDNTTVTTVKVNSLPSTWVPGEAVNIRTPNTPGVSESNNRLVIRGFDVAERIVSFSNPGVAGNVPEGTLIKTGRTVYLDERSEPTTAILEGNFFNGNIPPGGIAFTSQAAIVVQAKSKVINNVIIGFGNGVFSRPVAHTPSFPAARGTIIGGNFIVTRRSLDYPNVYTYGINVAGGHEKIYDNIVICPVSWKTVGIAAQAEKTLVWRCSSIADEIMINGYYSANRTTGIGNGYGGAGLNIWDCQTRGFDVGVGSVASNAWPSFKCCGHTSIMDYVAIQTANRIPCE